MKDLATYLSPGGNKDIRWEFSDETIVRQELIDAVKAEILKEGKYQQYLYKKMLADDFEQVGEDVMTAIDVILKGVQ